MADIFISYAREDIATAKRLSTELEAHRWSVFWDRRILAGERFEAIIAGQLASAKCVITLWSSAANASDWVKDEAGVAKMRNILVPALIEQVDPPMGFRGIHAVDLVQWHGEGMHEGFQGLLKAIEQYVPSSIAVDQPIVDRGLDAGIEEKAGSPPESGEADLNPVSADAMTNLGSLYETGHGVVQDYHQALKWYRKAASAGNASAMTSLGNLFHDGRGVRRDYKRARQWYEKAAAAGNAWAMTNLGCLYERGNGVTQDYQLALQWHKKSAAAGNAWAMNNLGNLYENGLGVKRDYQRARQWYEKAAAGGDTLAMTNLGNLYYNSRGVKQDYQRARQWYEKATHEVSPAQTRLHTLQESK